MSEMVRQQVGNYRLERILGRGGFADVYLAQHVFLPRTAAIKFLHTTLQQESIEQFKREAQTIATLEHLNIIRILDFGVSNQEPYLVMEYAENGSLRALTKRGNAVPIATVVTYIKQVALALQYAHDHKVIHRDVKPDNFLMRKDDTVALADFGILSEVHSSLTQHTSEAYAGTLAYSAPEQLQGRPRPASDQYSLAVVVYEWLTGTPPFKGATFAEVALKHITEPVPTMQVNKNISPGVEEVIMRALEKDPQKRFPGVLAFARALEDAAASFTPTLYETGETQLPERLLEPIVPVLLGEETKEAQNDTTGSQIPPVSQTELALTSPPGNTVLADAQEAIAPTPHVSRPAHQRPRPAMVVGLILFAILAVSGIGLAALHFLAPQLTFTCIVTGNLTPGCLLLTYRGHSDNVRSVAWSPDGKYIASGSLDHTVQVWNAATGKTVLTYNGHNSYVQSVTWSPGGKYIASGSLDHTVQVWNATTGSKVLTYRGHSDNVRSVAWSPDGKYIASGGEDKTVQVWNAATGSKVLTYTGHHDWVLAVVWSPDGKYVASGSLDHTVQVWNAATGKTVLTYSGHRDWVYSVAWSPDGKYIASGSSDKTVQVWNAATGSKVLTYTGHHDWVYSVAWSPDGKYIASGSVDHTVQVWNAATGSKVLTYRGHSDNVNSVAWSPDGKYIASGSVDHTVQVWQAPSS